MRVPAPTVTVRSAGSWSMMPASREVATSMSVLAAAHRSKVRRLELQRHVAVLLHAHAVLAGDRTAGLDAGGEDLEARRLRPFELVRTKARIEQDQRMKVAVARVKDVRDPKPMPH